MENLLITILIFLLGASIGSFLSVVIYRIRTNKKGIIFGQSQCQSCKKKLTSLDLIPIVSYIVLRGKCRKCSKKISPQYIFLEIITGLVLVAIYTKFPFFLTGTISLSTLLPFILFSIYSIFFIAIFFFDLRTSKIPDAFLFPLIGITIIGSLILGTPGIISMILAALIALIFFGGQILLSKGKWLGEGDLIFSFSLAIIFGWQLFLVSIISGYFVGAMVSIPLLISKKAKLKATIPFGPFLVIGAFITIFFGLDILEWYLATLYI